MGQDEILFYVGLALIVIGLLVWLFGPNKATGRITISIPGGTIDINVPAVAVMVIGGGLIWLSPNLHREAEKPTVKNVCFSNDERFCPGPSHDIYYRCSAYYSIKMNNDGLGKAVCSVPSIRITELKDIHGGECGFHLFEVVCPVK